MNDFTARRYEALASLHGVTISPQTSSPCGPLHIARKGDIATMVTGPDSITWVAHEWTQLESDQR